MSYEDILKGIYKRGEGMSPEDIPDPIIVPTPSPYINWALDGGIVRGRTYCIEGPPSGGKSMFTHAVCACLLRQMPDSVVIWYDPEPYNKHWHGVFMPDIPQNRIIIPPTGTDAVAIFDHFLQKMAPLIDGDKGKDNGLKVAAVVIDSLQSMIPPKIKDRESTGDAQYAPLAGWLPNALSEFLIPIRKHNIPFLAISQIRTKMDASKWDEEKTQISGGKAWQHAIDCEISFEVIDGVKSKNVDETIKNANDKGVRIGHRVRMKNKKNKIGAPYRIAEFDLNYQKGIVNIEQEIAALGVNLGIITLDGNTYSFNGQKLAVGLPKTLEVIASSQAIQEAIIAEVAKRG
jgi:recombination protein RecA